MLFLINFSILFITAVSESLATASLYAAFFDDALFGNAPFGEPLFGNALFGEPLFGNALFGGAFFDDALFGGALFGGAFFDDALFGDAFFDAGCFADDIFETKFLHLLGKIFLVILSIFIYKTDSNFINLNHLNVKNLLKKSIKIKLRTERFYFQGMRFLNSK
jgi:hypothetical protein